MRVILRSGLFRRLFLATLLVTLVVIVLSLVSSGLEYQKHIRAETELRHDTVARRMAMEMGLFFDQAHHQLTVLSGFIKNIPEGQMDINLALNDICLAAPHFIELGALGPDGKWLGTSSPSHGASIVDSQEAMMAARDGMPWVSDVRLDSNRVPYMVMSVPIESFSGYRGAVVGQVALKKLWYWIDEIKWESKTSLTVVKTVNGMVIADEEKKKIAQKYEHWATQRRNHSFEGPDGPYYMSFHDVPGADLTIVTVSRIGSFREYLAKDSFRLAAVGLGLVALAAILSAIFSARATRPVRILIEAMNDYALTGQKIEPGLEGEYGRIASAFNHVAQVLEENRKVMVTQESLVTVGRVAAILAHELRHELQMINNMVYLMDAQEEEKNTLNRIVAEMAKKISGIMDLARGSKIDPEPTGALRLMEEALEYVYLSEYAEKVDLESENPEGLEEFSIMVDRGKVSMAISNMVRNSVEAQATRIRIGLRLEKDSAIYYVSDNGSGMAPETL
ncbi:MAG: sensor histidine kinase, partial [Nitrospinota bacterium]|nr:sensor histidine kinase [Nitrospinota bacterium]